MTRHGTPIREYPLHRKFDSGIDTYAPSGYVSEYEVREAARFGNYSWSAWLELDYADRAVAVAHYRIHHLIEAHVNDAVDREIEANRARHANQ